MNTDLVTVSVVIEKEIRSLDCEALKQRYLGCFRFQISHVVTWKEVVVALVERGFSRGTLLEWGMEAGYDKEYVSKVLSQILCPAGRRERKPGAGRKTPAEAFVLLDYAERHYGKNYLKMLRAALTVAKARIPAKVLPEPQRVALSLLDFRQLSVLIPDGNKELQTVSA